MSGRSEREMIADVKMQEKLNSLPEIFTEFYYYMSSTKSYTTVKNYIMYVRKFALFEGNEEIKDDFYKKVVPLHINKYFSQIKNKEVNGEYVRTSDSIRATQWSALNTFFGFLKKNGYIDENPMEKTDRPEVKDNPDVSYLTEDEIHKILNNVKERANDKVINRDLAILMLGFTTGLRISAIIQINMQDINWKNGTIKVIEKRGKSCEVIIGEKLKEQLKLWIKDRNKYFDTANTDALFISSYRQRITRDGVAKMLDKYSKGATDKRVTPHVMRHSTATNLYEKTGDIYLCMSVLNHKSVATTQRYANMSKEKKKQASDILDKMI